MELFKSCRKIVPCLFLLFLSVSLTAMGREEETTEAGNGEESKGFGSFIVLSPSLGESPPFATYPGDAELLFLCQLFRGLVSINPDSGTVEPDLAESWEILNSGKTYRFTLKESFWSDGSKIRAEDYRKSIVNVLNQGPQSQGRAYVAGFIEGAEDYLNGRSSVQELGVRAKGEDVLELDFVRSLPYALKLLAHYAFLLYPDELFKEESFGITPLGEMKTSGCTLSLSTDEPGVSEMTLNRAWSTDGTEKIIFTEVKQAAEGLEMYLNGLGDWLTEIPLPRLYDIDYRYDYEIAPDYTSYFYFLNTRKSPLDDPELRQRLALSPDREYLTDQILRGAQRPTDKLVPPALYSVTQRSQDLNGLPSPVSEKFDLPEPADILPPLQLIYPTNEGHRIVAEYLVDEWADAGISVETVPLEWIDFLKAREEGEYHIALGGWQAAYNDPMSFLSLFLSAEKRWGSVYANPAFDDYILKAEDLPEGEMRRESLHLAESVLAGDQAFITLFFNGRPQLIDRDKWRGAPVRLPGYYTSFKYLSR